MLLLMFATVQLARVFYVYHTLEKALRGGAGLLARSTNVNYCAADDATITDARNFIIFGNLQGEGVPVVQGLTTDMIQVHPERQETGGLALATCTCGGDSGTAGDSCDVASGGRGPEFIVVNLSPLYQLRVAFPFVSFGTIPLNVSVRMPVTGS
jgi:hypothetical protein